MLRRTKIALVMVQPAGAESKGGLDTTTAARPESLLAVEKRPESLSGTIIREWHPQGKIPGRLARRKTLTRFLRWRGPLAPTAPLNSSIGAGWITPASLQKKHRIGAGLRLFIRKTAIGSWIFGGTCWTLARAVRLKHACAGTMETIGGSCFEWSLRATIAAIFSNGMARIPILRIVSAPK